LQGEIKAYVEKRNRAISEWKQAEIVEMTIMPDYIHMGVIIPPKLTIAELMGVLKNGDSRFPTAKKIANQTILG
jgi:putative transposase